MATALRDIVIINEDLCDGCGDCITACEEGALEIVNGKVKLKAEVLCDGAGVCIGHCPTGALTIKQQQAEAFNEAAVAQNLLQAGPAPAEQTPIRQAVSGGCPGSAVREFQPVPVVAANPGGDCKSEAIPLKSQLAQWPVQLMLLPPTAPWFADADLVLAADCVPFAYANFHNDFLKGRSLAIGCPKLDDLQLYLQKLTEIFKANKLKSVEVLLMEVPCCGGLGQAAQAAKEQAGADFPLKITTFSLRGEILESQLL